MLSAHFDQVLSPVPKNDLTKNSAVTKAAGILDYFEPQPTPYFDETTVKTNSIKILQPQFQSDKRQESLNFQSQTRSLAQSINSSAKKQDKIKGLNLQKILNN